MSLQAEFSPIASRSGYIEKISSPTVVWNIFKKSSGYNPKIGFDRYDVDGYVREWRGALSYDTSSLPDAIEVLNVEVYVDLVTNVIEGSNPSNWKNYFFIGDFGADFNQPDWNLSSNACTKDWAAPDTPVTGYVPMQTFLSVVNPSGYTDFLLRDGSLYTGTDAWHTIWAADSRAKLRITYRKRWRLLI